MRALLTASECGIHVNPLTVENGMKYLRNVAMKRTKYKPNKGNGGVVSNSKEFKPQPYDAEVAELLLECAVKMHQKLQPYEVAFINGLYESRAILPTYELSVLCRVLRQMDDDRWMHVAELFEQYIDRNTDQWTAHINLGPNGGDTFLRGMTVTNVNEIVQEVFDVTGFADILTIE